MPAELFFAVFPISILTSATLAQLAEIRPENRFEERQFWMNLIVATAESGFVKNAWIGRAPAAGQDAQLQVTMPDSRCAMMTLAQDEDELRTLSEHNQLEVGRGKFSWAGSMPWQ